MKRALQFLVVAYAVSVTAQTDAARGVGWGLIGGSWRWGGGDTGWNELFFLHFHAQEGLFGWYLKVSATQNLLVRTCQFLKNK